jgi:flagellar hook-associated protein 2
MDALMRPYVETGGIISSRTRTIDSQVARQERDIENFDRQLASKEAELKRKYGMMEGALGRMESSATAWENFGNQND